MSKVRERGIRAYSGKEKSPKTYAKHPLKQYPSVTPPQIPLDKASAVQPGRAAFCSLPEVVQLGYFGSLTIRIV